MATNTKQKSTYTMRIDIDSIFRPIVKRQCQILGLSRASLIERILAEYFDLRKVEK